MPGHASVLGCGIGWVCGFTGSGGGILMLTVFSLVLGYNLKVAVGTSTMIMTLVALTGAVSHISLGARIFPLPMAVVVLSCLLGAVVSAKFANRCEIARLNRIVGIGPRSARHCHDHRQAAVAARHGGCLDRRNCAILVLRFTGSL